MENFNHGFLAQTCCFPHPQSLPSSVIFMELSLKGGTSDDLRIPPGRVGEFTAPPHLEEGNAEEQGCRFPRQCRGTGICSPSRAA